MCNGKKHVNVIKDIKALTYDMYKSFSFFSALLNNSRFYYSLLFKTITVNFNNVGNEKQVGYITFSGRSRTARREEDRKAVMTQSVKPQLLINHKHA